MGENTLERYRQDIIDALRNPENAVRADFIVPMCQIVQRYVAHDLEWAALAVEEANRLLTADAGSDVLSGQVHAVLDDAAAAIRERGRA